MDYAPNGVPIVQIAPPNAAGLSHNIWASFKVESNGLIINNAISDYNSQLGGSIRGNQRLQQSAKVILNEVTGIEPSPLRGPIEIAGDKADLIISNPNGLIIDGARLINIGRMTLTTAIPRLNDNGDLQTLRVNFGTTDVDITIEGDGLDAKGADSVDLYAQALHLNAKLYAHALSLRLGSQDIDYPSGKASPNEEVNFHQVLLDSSELGGMYADRITLVGSGAGLGVKLPPVVRVDGDFQISVEGNIQSVSPPSVAIGEDGEIYGKPESKFEQIILQTLAPLVSAFDVGSNVQFSSGSTTVAVGGDLMFEGASLDLPKSVKVSGNAKFVASGDLRTHDLEVGVGYSGSLLRLEAAELFNDGEVSVDGDLELQIEHRWHHNQGSSMIAYGGDVLITTSAARIRLPKKTRSDDCGRNCEDLDIVTADIMRRADAEASQPNLKQPDSVALVIDSLETLRNIKVRDGLTDGSPDLHHGTIALIPRVTDDTQYDLVVFTTQETEHWRNKHGKVKDSTTTKTNQEDFLGYDSLWDLPKFTPRPSACKWRLDNVFRSIFTGYDCQND